MKAPDLHRRLNLYTIVAGWACCGRGLIDAQEHDVPSGLSDVLPPMSMPGFGMSSEGMFRTGGN